MSAAWAVVLDTWHQSKQQVVFMILIAAVVLITAFAIVLPKVHEHEDRELARFGWLVQDKPLELFEQIWIARYAVSLKHQEGDRSANPDNIGSNDLASARKSAHAIPLVRRGAEMWVYLAANAAFTMSMLLFLAACSAYFPTLLTSGTADVIVARPLGRLWIFSAKFFGGLVLYAIVLSLSYGLIFAGVGLRTGEWIWGVFLVIPLQIYTAASLFAIMALLGVVFRSTALSLITGYFFYLVIDTVVGGLNTARDMGWLDDFPKLKQSLLFLEYCPSFGAVKEISTDMCLSLPHIETQPLIITGAWGLVAFLLAYWRFSRLDL